MNVLLVEDEEGIREGLASVLRLSGLIVRVAGTCAEGVRMARDEEHDVVVTDWRLGDGTGQDIVEAFDGPVVIMSGHPDEVRPSRGRVRVLRKPVLPQELLGELRRMVRQEVAETREADHEAEPSLPPDLRDRVRLACALAGGAKGLTRDDGALVCLRLPLPDEPAALLERLSALGGDQRVLTRGEGSQVELRWHRDGRPAEGGVQLRPDQDWPEHSSPIVVDFDGEEGLGPDRFLELVERAACENRAGRNVYFANVPQALRLWLEISGKAHDMPKRPVPGPRMPEVLASLWS